MKLSPSILVSAAFIGPGTITTASLAGANFGYALVWALVLSVLLTMLFQALSAKLALVTGMDLAANIRSIALPQWFRRPLMALVIGAIVIGNAAYEGGNISGAALGLQQIFPNVSWVPLISLLAGALLLWGSMRVITLALTALVGLMALVFLLCSLIALPSLSLLIDGLSTPFPTGSEVLVLALIGTTLVPYNLFLHSSLIAKDRRSHHPSFLQEVMSESHRDIAIGGLITLAVLSTSAVAFFATQTTLSGANLASQLVPLLGSYAGAFFATGIFAAGLTSAITAPMAAAFCLCSLFNWTSNGLHFKGIGIAVLAFGAVIASTSFKPITVILFAQVTNGFLLPIIALTLLWLTSQSTVMTHFTNARWVNAIGSISVLTVLWLVANKLTNLF